LPEKQLQPTATGGTIYSANSALQFLLLQAQMLYSSMNE